MIDEEFKSKGKPKTFIEVDYNDIDDLINRHFPGMNGSYEIVAYEEWANDEDHDFHIDGKLSDYDRWMIHKMIDSGKWNHYSTHIILNYLCANGVIEPANYLISVCW